LTDLLADLPAGAAAPARSGGAEPPAARCGGQPQVFGYTAVYPDEVCIHEHACVRCPMLRPLPGRLPLLREVEANLVARIAEAEERVWLGEVKGLQDTLEALRGKTARLKQFAVAGVTDAPESMA
jgi:hypothetical protein